MMTLEEVKEKIANYSEYVVFARSEVRDSIISLLSLEYRVKIKRKKVVVYLKEKERAICQKKDYRQIADVWIEDNLSEILKKAVNDKFVINPKTQKVVLPHIGRQLKQRGYIDTFVISKGRLNCKKRQVVSDSELANL